MSSNNRSPLAGVRYEHLVAGVSGGVASTLLLHPLDLLRIRFAVNDSAAALTSASTKPHYTGLTQSVVQIFRHEGIRGLYRGVTPNVWGTGSAWGLYFLFYNTIKSYFQGGNSKVQLGPELNMVAAAEAGVLSLAMTNPIWVVKTRLCLQYPEGASGATASATQYNGMMDALIKTYKYEGFRGLYKGFVPGVFGISQIALQFMAYEDMKVYYNRYRNLPIDSKLTMSGYITFASLSMMFSTVATYPYQVVMARMMDQHTHYHNVRHCIQEIWRLNGVRGYFKGLAPSLMRLVPATAITIAIHEKMYPFLLQFRSEDDSTISEGHVKIQTDPATHPEVQQKEDYK